MMRAGKVKNKKDEGGMSPQDSPERASTKIGGNIDLDMHQQRSSPDKG